MIIFLHVIEIRIQQLLIFEDIRNSEFYHQLFISLKLASNLNKLHITTSSLPSNSQICSGKGEIQPPSPLL